MEKSRGKDNVIGRDSAAPKEAGNLLPMEEGEGLKRAFITKTAPGEGVNVVHHKADLRLGEVIQAGAFWDAVTDEFMIAFGSPLLFRMPGVTVKNSGAGIALSVQFNGGRMGKLRAVICEQDREKVHETVRPEFKIKAFKDVKDRLSVIGIAQESEHKA